MQLWQIGFIFAAQFISESGNKVLAMLTPFMKKHLKDEHRTGSKTLKQKFWLTLTKKKILK